MDSRDAPLYSETQPFRHGHLRVALAFPPVALLIIACRQIVWNKPWANPPLSNGGLIFLTVLLFMVYVRLNTVRLVTELRQGELLVGLRGLWKRHRIPVRDIRSTAVVTYDAALDFGGYGIRRGRWGAAYIARGSRALELTVGEGKILIGSQHPEELESRLRELLQRR